jgi:CheY-like chemotaxis protein
MALPIAMQKILLTGQDEHLLLTRAAVLRATGADVLSCGGSQAIAMAKSEIPDLIVLCHSLTDSEAETIAAQIYQWRIGTRILLVSSDMASDAYRERASFDGIASSQPERLVRAAKDLLNETAGLNPSVES